MIMINWMIRIKEWPCIFSKKKVDSIFSLKKIYAKKE